MNTENIIKIGVQGIHVLFDNETIVQAFSQDADYLRDEIEKDLNSIQAYVQKLGKAKTIDDARAFLASLPTPIRYLFVLLYFEMIDERLRKQCVFH